MLRKYKETTYDSMMVANKADGLITGLAASAMMFVIDGCFVKHSIILQLIGTLFLLCVIIGSLLSDRIHSSNKRYYYNNVHSYVLKSILEERGLSYAL